MTIALDSLVINLIASIILVTLFLWVSGRSIVGKEKAQFKNAALIAIIGAVIGTIFGVLLAEIISSISMLIIWLALVKRFFETSWLKALAISILAVILILVIAVILDFAGFGIWGWELIPNLDNLTDIIQ